MLSILQLGHLPLDKLLDILAIKLLRWIVCHLCAEVINLLSKVLVQIAEVINRLLKVCYLTSKLLIYRFVSMKNALLAFLFFFDFVNLTAQILHVGRLLLHLHLIITHE